MEFAQPYYLFILLLLPLLLLWYFKKGQNQEATLRFSNLDLIPEQIKKKRENEKLDFYIQPHNNYDAYHYGFGTTPVC